MENRLKVIWIIAFLIFAEAVSWVTADGPGPCLMERVHRQQSDNEDDQHYCPTFFAGSLLVARRSFEWVKREDNDKAVVAAFTVILAISTIGLWISTHRLWVAGEKQLRMSGYAAGISASAIGVTREIGEAQVRAYVSIKSASIVFCGSDGMPMVEIVATNSGQSPAIDFIWAPEIFYLSEVREAVSSEIGDDWEDQPGLDIHSASQTTAGFVVDDFVLEEKTAIDGCVPAAVAVSVTVHYIWSDVFGRSFDDCASFAGMAEKGDIKENRKRHPLNTSPWFCHLRPIAKGQPWSGIAVRAPRDDEGDA